MLRTGFLLLVVLIAPACGNQLPDSTAPEDPTRQTLSIQAVIVSDDDGRRPAPVEIADIERAITLANRVFDGAAIEFTFDPARDVSELRSTTINYALDTDKEGWPAVKRSGHETAAQYPGKLVLFFRHGPGEQPTGQGFGSREAGFVVLPGTVDLPHCGEPHDIILAHEIGHYLGLAHCCSPLERRILAGSRCSSTIGRSATRSTSSPRRSCPPARSHWAP